MFYVEFVVDDVPMKLVLLCFRAGQQSRQHVNSQYTTDQRSPVGRKYRAIYRFFGPRVTPGRAIYREMCRHPDKRLWHYFDADGPLYFNATFFYKLFE